MIRVFFFLQAVEDIMSEVGTVAQVTVIDTGQGSVYAVKSKAMFSMARFACLYMS